jgi:peptide chain release factor 3
VEEQTRKLMEVCRLRNYPVIIFINKLDREGKLPIELLDELEKELDINVRPLSWPVGMGSTFRGVYNIYKNTFNLFRSGKYVVEDEIRSFNGLDDPELDSIIGHDTARLREEIELVDSIYDKFEVKDYLSEAR